jgi:UDP-N-acetylmuramyl tripeptide synthase
MYFVARLIGKAIAFLSPLLKQGGGTSAPGMALLKIHSDAFSKLTGTLPKGSIFVSATNGKTTTTRFLSEIISSSGTNCISNSSGANLKSGIATALLTKKPDQEIGVLEVDEAALPEIVGESKPEMLILMNLFRDQLDRHGELESIANRWHQMVMDLPNHTKLIVNADDPTLAHLGLQRTGTVFFGLGNAFDYSHEELQHASDSTNCPECQAPLSYSQATLSHMGNWECTKCDLTRPKLNFEASEIQLDGLTQSNFAVLNNSNRYQVTSKLPGIHNVYNALAAFTAASELNVDPNLIASTIRQTDAAFGRTEKVVIDQLELHILLAKNPAGANANIDTVLLHNGPVHLCVLLNDRIADGRDVSWIWDVDYERFFDRIETLHIGGERAYDVALRFLYGGFENDEIMIFDSIPKLLNNLVSSIPANSQIFVLPSYTAMLDFRDELVKRDLTHAFWKDGS